MSAPARRTTVLVVGVSALLAAAVFVVVKDALIDDAYITLAYAKNLAVHGQWGPHHSTSCCSAR